MKVRITAWQRVHYDQTFEMTQEEYDELCERMDTDPHFGSKADCDIGWLDLTNEDDYDELEDIDISVVKEQKV